MRTFSIAPSNNQLLTILDLIDLEIQIAKRKYKLQHFEEVPEHFEENIKLLTHIHNQILYLNRKKPALPEEFEF